MPEDFTVHASPPGTRPVQWLTLGECAKSDPPPYIVKSVIAAGDLVLIFGPPGTGKSCLAPRIAYAVAQGEPIFGRRVRPGPVLYVAAEDGRGMRLRLAALEAELGDATDLLLTGDLAGFMDPGSSAEVELRAKIAATCPVLIMLDTIAAGFPGLQENDSGPLGMGRVTSFARALIADCGAAVVLIHHAPKGDGGTPRGHGSLHGDADVALALSRDDQGLIRVSFTKNRNGPSDGRLCFTVRPVTLGTDGDGDPITAPICEPQDDTGPSGPRLSPAERVALGILHDLLATEGTPLPTTDGFPSSTLKGVRMDRWQSECLSRHLSAAKDDEGRKRGFREIRTRLRDKQRVGMRDEWVWAIHPH